MISNSLNNLLNKLKNLTTEYPDRWNNATSGFLFQPADPAIHICVFADGSNKMFFGITLIDNNGDTVCENNISQELNKEAYNAFNALYSKIKQIADNNKIDPVLIANDWLNKIKL